MVPELWKIFLGFLSNNRKRRQQMAVAAATSLLLVIFFFSSSSLSSSSSENSKLKIEPNRPRRSSARSKEENAALFKHIDASADGLITEKELAWAIQRRVKKHAQK